MKKNLFLNSISLKEILTQFRFKGYVLYFVLGFFGVFILSFYIISLNISTNPQAKECVALIHGLGRGPRSFFLTKVYLTQAGYKVITPGYPSTKENIDFLASKVVEQIYSECENMEKIHIVTHSLGGIIVRYLLTEKNIEKIGHVVMLAPPNKGSEIVDTFKNYTWFQWINGPTGITLGTQQSDLPKQLPIPQNISIGIIAGSISLNPFYSYLIDGEDDGKVSIESTKLNQTSAHIIIPSSHTFIMNNPLVLVQIKHFLKFGFFNENLSTKSALGEVFHDFIKIF